MSPDNQPRPPRKSPNKEQDDLLTWTPTSHESRKADYWCTPAEAAVILEVSPERVRQLIYGPTPTFPSEQTPQGRLLLRRADVEWAVDKVGEPGSRDRWSRVRSVLMGEEASRPSRRRGSARRHPRSEEINALPWEQIIADYQAGTSTATLISRYQISRDTFQTQLRRRGIPLRRGQLPGRLLYSDDELRQRYADGATYAQLAAECGVSTTLVWRRVRRIQSAEPPPASVVFPAGGRKSDREERAELDAWTYTDHRKNPDPYWCTAADAARLLDLSRDRVRQLINDNVLLTERTGSNRHLIRTADIRIALRVLNRDSGGRMKWRQLRGPSERPPS